MKRLLKIFSVTLIFLMCSLGLSGCVRFHTTFNVKSNGKIDATMLFAAMDMSEYGYDGDSISRNATEELRDDGWDVEKYSEDGFDGYILTKKDITPEELQENMETTRSELGDSGQITLTKKGRNYVLDWQVFDAEESDEMASYKSYFKMTGGYMKLTVTLPNKPVESNATSVSNDGKTLEWDLLDLGPDQSVHVEFSPSSMGWLLPVCIVGGLLLAAVLVVVLILVLRDRKARQAQNMAAGYPQNGGYPNQNIPGCYPQGGGFPNQNMPGSYPQNGEYPNQNVSGNYPQNGEYLNQNVSGNYPQNGGFPNQNTTGNYTQNGGYQNAPGSYPQNGGYQASNPTGNNLQPGGFTPQNYAQQPQQMPEDDQRFKPKPKDDLDEKSNL